MIQVTLDLKDLLVQLDLLAQQDPKVQQGFREVLERPDHKVILVLRDPQELRVIRETLELQD